MKEKNGFFAKTENKVEILTKIFLGGGYTKIDV